MAIGIRKPGQGYWVRVLSAVFWGALVAAGAGYAWGQAGTIRIPIESWLFTSPSIDAGLEAGDIVKLVRLNTDDGEEVFGSGVVEAVTRDAAGSGTISVTGFSDDDARDLADDAVRLIEGELTAPIASALIPESSAQSIAAYPQQYLQAGAAGVVLIIGSIGLYWFHGVGRKSTDFLINTDGEMRKVNWSTRREIQGSTIVVIVATFLISGFLFSVDSLFGFIFRMLDVLQT